MGKPVSGWQNACNTHRSENKAAGQQDKGSCCAGFHLRLVTLLSANLSVKIRDCEWLNFDSSSAASLPNVSRIAILERARGFEQAPWSAFFPSLLVALCSAVLLDIACHGNSLGAIGGAVIFSWCAEHLHSLELLRYVTCYLICKFASLELFMTSLWFRFLPQSLQVLLWLLWFCSDKKLQKHCKSR